MNCSTRFRLAYLCDFRKLSGKEYVFFFFFLLLSFLKVNVAFMSEVFVTQKIVVEKEVKPVMIRCSCPDIAHALQVSMPKHSLCWDPSMENLIVQEISARIDPTGLSEHREESSESSLGTENKGRHIASPDDNISTAPNATSNQNALQTVPEDVVDDAIEFFNE